MIVFFYRFFKKRKSSDRNTIWNYPKVRFSTNRKFRSRDVNPAVKFPGRRSKRGRFGNTQPEHFNKHEPSCCSWDSTAAFTINVAQPVSVASTPILPFPLKKRNCKGSHKYDVLRNLTIKIRECAPESVFSPLLLRTIVKHFLGWWTLPTQAVAKDFLKFSSYPDTFERRESSKSWFPSLSG